MGVRGAHVTFGRRYREHRGHSRYRDLYTSRQGAHSGYHSAKHDAPVTPNVQAAADRSAERTIGLVVLSAIAIVVFLLLR